MDLGYVQPTHKSDASTTNFSDPSARKVHTNEDQRGLRTGGPAESSRRVSGLQPVGPYERPNQRPQPIIPDAFAEERSITFIMPKDCMDDVALNLTYKNEKELTVATMVRDLQVVVVHHMKRMMDAKVFPVSAVTTPAVNPKGPKSLPLDGLSEICEKVIELHEICKGTLNDGGHLTTVAKKSHAVTTDVYNLPYKPWPLNKSGIYFSNLVSRFTGYTIEEDQQKVEVTDYCLRVHDNYDPDDAVFIAQGGLQVKRRDFWSLELDQDIRPTVVSAWSRVMVDVWQRTERTYRACLDVVKKVPNIAHEQELDNWLTWIDQCQIDIAKAELICIPMCMDGEYNLLCINFQTRKYNCVDTKYNSDRSSWEEFTNKTINLFWGLIERCGDSRTRFRDDFYFELLHPHWSTTMSDSDSGLTTMHLIDHIGEPSCEYGAMRLHEEHVRIHLRVALCATIVISKVNVLREIMLAKVQDMIVEKNCTPTS